MLIQKLRDGSDGVMAKIIIGLIVIVFGLFGFGSITTFLAPVAKVATVNGENVTQQAMEVAVERNRRLLMARGLTADQINEDELRDNVLRGLISREVLAQAADDMNLHYSDVAIDDEIVGSQIFQIDGVFSADQFQNVLRGAGYTPLSYRDEMRTDKLFQQMLSGVTQSAFVTDAEAKRYSAVLGQVRDIAYIHISAAELIEEVTVLDEEIAEYYTENSIAYVTEETVDLQYVELTHEELAASLDLDANALQQYFDDNIGDYSTDEERRVAHILLETDVDGTSEDTKVEADAAYQRILGGEDFSALADELSDDIGSKSNGGDLGFNPQGTFFPEFEAVAYDLGLNQVSEPVETDLGFHIIKVIEINEGNVPSLADMRAEVEQAYRLAATDEDFVSTSSRLAELLFESIDLEVPANELGLEIKSTGHLSRAAKHELMTNSTVANVAFSPDVLIDGNNSDLIELSASRHIGVRVLEHQPSSSKPLDEVREDIRYILQQQAAQALAQQRAEAIVSEVEQGSLAAYVADQYKLEWQIAPGASRFTQEIEPTILAEAFKLNRPQEDRESLGVATMGNGDSVVLRVSEVTNRPVDQILEIELAAVKSNLSGQLGASDFQDLEVSRTLSASINRSN
jgi:peptidyl-prolyl cis-trans isomerase D